MSRISTPAVSRWLRRWSFSIVVVLALAGLPPLRGWTDFDLLRLDHIIALVMVAIGLNVVTGFAGQLSLGPGAVFAVGGYVAAILAFHYPDHVNLPVMCAVGIGAAAIVGLIAGVPALRVSGFYLGMVTLYLALLIPSIVDSFEVTGGNNGIDLLQKFPDFTQDLSGMPLYEVTLGAMLAVVAFTGLLLYSRVGRRFTALRTSEVLAESLGVKAYRTKLLAFVISALPAGLGGAFYVYSQELISKSSIDPLISINLLAACVIGGFGRVWGPVVGGAIVLGLDQFGSNIPLVGERLQEWELLINGVLLILIILLLPEGLVGFRPLDALRRLRRRGVELRVVRFPPTVMSSGPPPLRRCAEPAGVFELSGISKRFGGVLAVDGVDLTLRPGSLHALIGPNGSGKTTLLNVASGFYRNDSGTMTVGNVRTRGGDAVGVARLGVARTFQTPKLIAGVSILDNVLVAADTTVACTGFESVFRLPRGIRCHHVARERALDCLRHVGLEAAAGLHAGEAPHGTRRLVEIARAMATDPLFLLLDEPAAGLSPAEVEGLKRMLRSLSAAGVGVLLVEHNMPLVLDLADEVTVLHRGSRIAHGGPAEVRRHPDVMRVYLGAA
ncbi:MAG TPA: branched-chain amino acid ABC transporter ATP-binding protein/permease [Candidatus Dormibacteraeota bacterium]|nr:branched-chain amino acid ABC transporter ATP-binding protein/permease [Candidatus Dormibacteraeota bacterium]